MTAGTKDVKVVIWLYLDHAPARFRVHPELLKLLQPYSGPVLSKGLSVCLHDFA